MQSKWLVKSATSIALVSIMAVETVCPAPAHAGVPGLFATEFTQILNYVELAGQLEQQVLMVENQLNQLLDMAKHGITITDQLFGAVTSDITNLRQIVNTGQALSYTLSNMDGTFRLRFPGYSTSTNYGQSYQTWSQTSLDSTLGALKAAGLQNSQFDSDEALLQTAPAPAAVSVPAGERSAYESQNDQQQKAAFSRQYAKPESEYLSAARQPARSPYEIKAGWLIPAVLEQQLNSDLPGMIRALVRENVYDSATGRYILIPSGSTLIGVYNSHVGYGQNALQAVWRRIVFPDGSSLALGGFEGDDSAGAAGFRDQVNNHWGRLLSGALLTSVFAAGIEVSQGTNSPSSSLGLLSPSVGQTVGQAVGQQVGELGTEVTRRNPNIQPTIVVRPGYRFFVRVEKDVQFSGPYAPLTGTNSRGSRITVSAGRDASGSQEVSKESSQKGGNSRVPADRSSSGGWNPQGEP